MRQRTPQPMTGEASTTPRENKPPQRHSPHVTITVRESTTTNPLVSRFEGHSGLPDPLLGGFISRLRLPPAKGADIPSASR